MKPFFSHFRAWWVYSTLPDRQVDSKYYLGNQMMENELVGHTAHMGNTLNVHSILLLTPEVK
jgi:hypothetical protein